MLEIKITAPELSEAINNLAKAMTARETTPLSGVTTGSAIADVTHTPAVPVTATPQTPVVPTAAANNTPAVPVAAPAVSTVPTSAPQYTLEMIAKAGTALIDAGKMHELTALLARYGVETLTALDPAHYGAFANELRAMGAAI